MKITGFKRLVKEDFSEDEQPLIEKLATVFNQFQEQVYYAFNNNITLSENIAAQTVSVRLRVSNTGVPIGTTQVKYTLKTRPKGSMVINVNNLTDRSLLSGSPFVSYELNGDLITIKQVTGLLTDKEYEVTIVFIG